MTLVPLAVAFVFVLRLPQGEEPKPPRVEGDMLVVEGGCNLRQVLDVLAPLAKRTVLVKRELNAKLSSAKLDLIGSLRVPVARCEALMESLFFSYDLIFMPPDVDGAPWEVADIRGPERTQIRSAARMIELKELDALAGRPVLVSLTVPIEHVQARELSASLRPFFPDSGLETVTNLGNTNALLVTGFVPTVNGILKLLRQIDVPSPPPPPVRASEIEALRARILALEKRLAPAESSPGETRR